MKILLVEPNPLASRLQTLAHMTRALLSEKAHEITLLVPPGCKTAHWEELMPEGDYKMRHFGQQAPSQNQYVTKSGAREMGKAILELGPQDVVIICAFDELTEVAHHPSGLSLARCLKASASRVLIIKYRSEHLMRTGLGPRRLQLECFLRASGGELVVFDERVLSRKVAGKHPIWLPDPSTPLLQKPAPRRTDGKLRLSSIGMHNWRKNPEQLLALSKWLSVEHPAVVLRVAGRWDKTLAHVKGQLIAMGNVSLEDRFLSEAEMVEEFHRADIVLLNYHRTFTATSGVLVQAAASGTPVVAASHGLVGSRVQNRNLGFTFVVDDVDSLIAAADLSIHYVNNSDRSVQKALKQFAEDSSPEKFTEALLAAVRQTGAQRRAGRA